MDYRDTEEYYTKKQTSKDVRLSRRQRHSEDTKKIIATGISLIVTLCLTAVMLSQLVSCSAPPPPTLEERWNTTYECSRMTDWEIHKAHSLPTNGTLFNDDCPFCAERVLAQLRTFQNNQ